MSMHKLPLSELEEEGLKAHGLSIETPSQLSDAFRQGIAWALSQQDGNEVASQAQDEREAVVTVAYIDLSMDAGVVLYANRDHWLDCELLMTVSQHERIVAALTRHAQKVNNVDTPEQQPVAWQHKKPTVNDSGEIVGYSTWTNGKGLDWWPHRPLYAAPIAQTAELERLLSEAHAQMVEAFDERDEVIAEVEALRKDAERYRFLCDPEDADEYYLAHAVNTLNAWADKSEIDQAVDAAMSAKEENKI